MPQNPPKEVKHPELCYLDGCSCKQEAKEKCTCPNNLPENIHKGNCPSTAPQPSQECKGCGDVQIDQRCAYCGKSYILPTPTPTSIMGVDDWLTDPKNLDIATLSGDTKRKIRTYVLRTAESAKRDERERILTELLAKAESLATAKDVRHLIKDYLLNL